jgi:hypothetical protein
MNRITQTLEKYEILIPIFLGVLFFVITAPGISWGTPSVWHPDELVNRVDNALKGGSYDFSKAYARCATRTDIRPRGADHNDGFRVVMTFDPDK